MSELSFLTAEYDFDGNDGIEKRGIAVELSVSGVVKNFGEKEVLKDISFQARSGEALGLLGRNGAGKTTTIRIVMGVFYPDQGEILIDGKPINRKKLRLGYLPEERGLYPKKLISEQLLYLAQLRGMNKADARKACDRWLDRMGMSEYKNKKLETLSKGNQQKIQLAATLMCDPHIVILDEPFSGLDPVNAMLLKEVIQEMIGGGAVVLFSSHQMNYVEEFCDDIAILNTGRIVKAGKITDIKRSYPRDRIEIQSEQSEKLIPYLLEKMGGEILSADTGKENHHTLLIRLKDASAKNRLFQTISQSGFDIDSFHVCEPSLNDIFVEYTEAGI